MTTVAELKTLKRKDFIEASGLYYKVFCVTKKGLHLSYSFTKGSEPKKGGWFSRFYSRTAMYNHSYWNIIRADSPEAKVLRF